MKKKDCNESFEYNDDEMLDVKNGILLSPLYDFLFDKHLVTFDDEGRLLVSSKINSQNVEKIGLSKDIKITLSEWIKRYFSLHRERFRRKEKELPD